MNVSKDSFNQKTCKIWRALHLFSFQKTKPLLKSRQITHKEELFSKCHIHDYVFLELEFRSKMCVLKKKWNGWHKDEY